MFNNNNRHILVLQITDKTYTLTLNHIFINIQQFNLCQITLVWNWFKGSVQELFFLLKLSLNIYCLTTTPMSSAYFNEHFDACNSLEGQQQEGHEWQPLALRRLLETSDDHRKLHVVLPADTHI